MIKKLNYISLFNPQNLNKRYLYPEGYKNASGCTAFSHGMLRLRYTSLSMTDGSDYENNEVVILSLSTTKWTGSPWQNALNMGDHKKQRSAERCFHLNGYRELIFTEILITEFNLVSGGRTANGFNAFLLLQRGIILSPQLEPGYHLTQQFSLA